MDTGFLGRDFPPIPHCCLSGSWGCLRRVGAACSIPSSLVSNRECVIGSVWAASLGLGQGRQALRRSVSSPLHLELPQTLWGAQLLPDPVHIVGDLRVDPIDLLAATFFRAPPGHQTLGHPALA